MMLTGHDHADHADHVHDDAIDYEDDDDINEKGDMMRCGRYVNMRPPSFPIDHVHVLPPPPRPLFEQALLANAATSLLSLFTIPGI